MGKEVGEMIDIKEIEKLKRRCLKAITAVRDIDTIEKILPVAFPLYDSTWRILVRVERTTGIVDRRILSAVRNLGPLASLELAQWMGLAPDTIEKTLKELVSAGVDLHFADGKWSLGVDADIERFYVEREHEFGFVANGLTGDFLTMPQVRALRSARIDIRKMDRLRTLHPMASSSEGPLMRRIRDSRAAHRYAGFGIPDGFIKFVDSCPVSEWAAYTLAFVFAFRDGGVEIVSACESAFRLDCPKKALERYLAEVNSPAVDHLEGIEFKDEGNRRAVMVKDGKLWECVSRSVNNRPEVLLLKKMIYSGWSCENDGAFHRLVPCGRDTMYRLALYRGLSLLRRSYSQITGIGHLKCIGEQYRGQCMRELPELKRPPDFIEVLKLAAESTDGNLVEIVRRFVPRSSEISEAKQSSARFIHSEGRMFLDAIVKAIDAARESILIVSPVIGEKEVFKALERARGRGVGDIRVITQLSEHRNNIFKTDPQFDDYSLPRRRLASLGVNVRDSEYTVHAKFIVVDSGWAFFTSANLNANSLGVGAVNAIEVGLECVGGDIVMALAELFGQVWYSATYRQVRNDDRITITRLRDSKAIEVDRCVLQCLECSCMLSTPENQLLMHKLCAMIAAARKDILILTMSFYDLEDLPRLAAEIVKALRRGVKIKVGVRPGAEMNFSTDQWPDPSTIHFCKEGLELRMIDHLHAKGIIVDGKDVLMMSANFNPYSLGSSPTAHIEMAISGAVKVGPLARFAAFARKLLA